MNDIEEITAGLMEVYRAFREGGIESNDANTTANVAGKVIGGYKLRLAYSLARGGEVPMMQGLETTPGLAALKGPEPA